MSATSDLPRSFEDLGKRLGFAPEQLRLRYGDREKDHEAFMATFGRSVLYAAERDQGFYRRMLARASEVDR